MLQCFLIKQSLFTDCQSRLFKGYQKSSKPIELAVILTCDTDGTMNNAASIHLLLTTRRGQDGVIACVTSVQVYH